MSPGIKIEPSSSSHLDYGGNNKDQLNNQEDSKTDKKSLQKNYLEHNGNPDLAKTILKKRKTSRRLEKKKRKLSERNAKESKENSENSKP